MSNGKPFDPLFMCLILLAALAYIVATIVLGWALPAVLISSKNDLMVITGIAIAAVWITASVCGVIYLFSKFSKSVKPTVEKHQ